MDQFFDRLTQINDDINGFVWVKLGLVLLLGTGILMTVLTCVFGMIPLVIATGVGANGNSTLGSGVVGGMIVGTLALLFLVPSLFIVFQHLQEKVKPIQFTNTPDWMIEAEIEDSKKENEEKK